MWKRFRKWRRHKDDPFYSEVNVRSLLNEVWADSKEFLKRPPDRARYDDWLSLKEKQMGWLSALMASQWAEPDAGFGRSAQMVSVDEIEARRRRIQGMYKLFRQGAYEPRPVEVHALRSGDLDRSIAE